MALRLVIIALVLALAPSARAAGACDAATTSWVDHCRASHGLTLEIVACPSQALVLRDPSAALDVEIAPVGPRSFRQVGSVGLSPVGEFANWDQEPEARRRMLSGLEACVRESPPPLAPVASLGAERGALRRVAPPWFLLLALGLFGAAATRFRRSWRAAAPDAGIGLGLFAATWLGRSALLPRTFFHQNGQGPGWISYALRDDVGLSGYGPGYPELFAASARLFGDRPEPGVWLWMSLLGALLPAAVYWIGRRLGAGRWPALAVALIACLDPVLGRLAQSESYFGAIIALEALALLALACAEPRLRSWRFACSLLSAGLFASAAARIHPSAWPALLFVPVVALLGPGTAKRRVRVAAVCALGIGLVIALTSASAMQHVLTGSLGQRWAPRVQLHFGTLGLYSGWLLVPLLGLVLTRSWRGVVIAVAGALAISALVLTDWLSNPNPLITAAHQRLYAPVLLVLVAAAVARARPRRALVGRGMAALLAGSALYLALTRAALAKQLPTDVLEAEFLMRERAHLERSALVAYVERAESRVVILPLYDGVTAGRVPIRVGEPLPRLADLPKPAYYVRTSLCASAEARDTCERVERGAKLELVGETELPARPSMRWFSYDSDPVPVKLWVVR